ncbi:MAG TPA: ATP-binding protein [Candidatus Angelobacter sp.]|jgi:DNA replication protein DnaC
METQLQAQSAEKSCPLCDGTGWKYVAVPGKGSRMTRCDCRKLKRNERLLDQSQIPPRYAGCSLENYSAHDSDSLAGAKLTAVRFVEEYPGEKRGLLFVGPYGVGKTHLAVGILRGLTEKGHACIFYDYRELLKEIQNSYNPQVDTPELSVLRPVFETEVLVLDDLGVVRPSEWVQDAVQYILNTRYNSRLTTIITTNFAILMSAKRDKDENIDRFQVKRAGTNYTLGDRIGDRMVSRLHEMCRMVALQGADYRQRPRSR